MAIEANRTTFGPSTAIQRWGFLQTTFLLGQKCGHWAIQTFRWRVTGTSCFTANTICSFNDPTFGQSTANDQEQCVPPSYEHGGKFILLQKFRQDQFRVNGGNNWHLIRILKNYSQSNYFLFSLLRLTVRRPNHTFISTKCQSNWCLT